MVRVLVVEDEANIREMIALNLRLAGMERLCRCWRRSRAAMRPFWM